MLSKSAFAVGIQRIELRFPKQKMPSGALDEYYDWLRWKLTDEQFLEASKVLFAEATRYPRPLDFIQAAPELETQRIPEEDRDRAYEAPEILVLRGSKAHKRWLRQFADRERAGVTDADLRTPTHECYGYPLPVLRVVTEQELEALTHERMMGRPSAPNQGDHWTNR